MDFWANAANELAQKVPEYQVSIVGKSVLPQTLDRIEYRDDRAALCLAPHTNYDFAGNLLGFTPLYCSELDTLNPVESMEQAIQNYQSQYIEVSSGESEKEFRKRILDSSSPQNPLCSSVYADLFSTGSGIPDMLEENYMIACANRIDSNSSWPNFAAKSLARWMRVDAALMSGQSALISSAFRGISEEMTQESIVYGAALEGYTEIMAKKQRQAEITALRAIEMSDNAGMYFLSRQNALLLGHIVSIAESMDGERLENIVRALAPEEKWPANVIDVRTMLQLRACQMSVIIPDVSSSLVSACLPWLKMSVRSEDDFEMALLLIEHGIYGTAEGEAHIAENVLSWLKNVSLSDELSALRHSFGQRISSNSRLSEDERAVVSEF